MNNELQAVVEYMEKERGIDRETIIQAVESALVSASRKGVGQPQDLRVEIDRNTFQIRGFAHVSVVDNVTDKHTQVSLHKARDIKPDAQLGDTIELEVPPSNLGRIAAQVAKQAIMHRIRQAEQERVFEEYKDRAGEIVSGMVRRFDRSDVVIDLGRAESVMPSRERVPTEEYQVGDRIRALILKVDNEAQGPEIILSRTHPDFVRRLFELEVSEIADGTVEIKGIAREPGFRSKIAVLSHDEKVDPVGACVGMRGIRVKNIVRELAGEKIDIVRWHADVKTFVANSLAPAKLAKVDIDEETHTIRVTVEGDQLSLAIGKKGQNARLTSKLTGWKIDIQKDEADMAFEERVALAVSNLAEVEGITKQESEILVHSGFLTVEGILAAEISDLEDIEGLDSESARRIREAAENNYEIKHGEPES